MARTKSRELTYDGHTGHLQHVGARMAHVRLRLAPAGDESLASDQPDGILGQADGQDVLRERRRLGQLQQGQIVAVRLCHAEVEARMDDLLQDTVLSTGSGSWMWPKSWVSSSPR